MPTGGCPERHICHSTRGVRSGRQQPCARRARRSSARASRQPGSEARGTSPPAGGPPSCLLYTSPSPRD
eukprot:11838210-Alexandrium_andersonii.AAC.1